MVVGGACVVAGDYACCWGVCMVAGGCVWLLGGMLGRVPTRPGKPGKMRVHLENLEISWNFKKFNKYHEKMT